jgi:fumarylpyruvate hydrolase
MVDYVVTPQPRPSVAVAGETARFPVERIYCVGFNYADHAEEMRGDKPPEPPILFSKAANSLLADGAPLSYPAQTADLQYEVELVVAIGRGGAGIGTVRALDHVYGYAVGNDYTRRDLQNRARAEGRPWDASKTFDGAAGIGAIHVAAMVPRLERARIWLMVNGVLRQESTLAHMIWKVPEIIAEVSTYYTLRPGDLIYTGTPAGVSPVTVGDEIVAGIEGLGTLTHRVVSAERSA